MSQLMQDFRHALRMLGQRKLFTIAAVLTIGLGIGASTAIFSVVYGVLLRPLPYKSPSELMLVWTEMPQSAGKLNPVGAQTYLDWREKNSVFVDMAAFRPRNSAVTLKQEGTSDKIRGAGLTVNMLELLGAQPFIGHDFTKEQGKLGNDNVVLVSYGLWQGQFGGDSGIVGKTIYIDGAPMTVIGVMPRGFEYPLGTLFWTPQAPEAFLLPSQGGARIVVAALQVIGRLKPGITYEQAETRMAVLNKQMEQGMGADFESRLRAESLLETIVGNTRTILTVFLGAVIFVLLIACANVANLLLVRAAAREQEIAVRAAMGASRWRLARHLLSESLLIAFLGAACGMVMAYGGIKLFLAFNPGNIPRTDSVRMDWHVMFFAVAATAITGLLFGLAPAVGATRPDLMRVLKGSSAGAGTSHRNKIRGGLVIVETVMAMVLLAGAGLLLKSFVRMSNVDTGIDTKKIITATVFPLGKPMSLGGGITVAQLTSGVESGQPLQEALDRLIGLPGIESVAFASSLPPGGLLPKANPVIEGKTNNPSAQPESDVINVSDSYFRTLHIPILGGSEFRPEDVAQKRNVAIVSEAFVMRFFPHEQPIGRSFRIESDPWTIIGVAKDVRQNDLRTPADAVIYLPRVDPLISIGNRRMAGAVSLILRTTGSPGPQLAAVKAALDPMSGKLRLIRMSLLDTDVWKDLAQPKFYLVVIGVFAGVALMLSGVGIYSVLAYNVNQRTREIGVRMALGAERGDILRLVIRQGMTSAILGAAGGMPASLALTRYLATILFDVKPTDVQTYAIVAIVLISVALMACFAPARRAMRVDPMTALRYE